MQLQPRTIQIFPQIGNDLDYTINFQVVNIAIRSDVDLDTQLDALRSSPS